MLPFSLLTVNVTVYNPALSYVCVGFSAVERVPSPKFHFLEVGAPVLSSVNLTARGAFPEDGDAEKAATGVSKPFETII